MSTNPSNLMPQRNPNLIQRVWNAITLRDPGIGPQPAALTSTETGVFATTAQALQRQFLSVENDRQAVYRDVDEMDDTSEEMRTALDTIADNVTTSEDGAQLSWQIKSEDPQIVTILEDLAKRTALHQKSFGLVRNAAKRGDVFNEIVVNVSADMQQLLVTDIRQLPASSMLRNQLRNGEQPMGIPIVTADGEVMTARGSHAFEQVDPSTSRIVAAFLPWQIAHIRHNWDGESVYGTAMSKTARHTWRKLMAEEQALVIGRLMRAFMKIVWYIDTTGLSKREKQLAITEFMNSVQTSQRMDSKRDAPFSVMSDIYLSDAWLKVSGSEVKESRTRAEPIDPKNAAMTAIDDVEYLHTKLMSTLRVPKAHMGFEKDVNAKSTLTTQDVQYVRFLRRMQQEVGQVLVQIFDTQLILLGYDPTTIDYEVAWPRLSASDEAAAADAEFSRAQADNIYVAAGAIDAQWIQEERLGMDEAAIAEISKRVQAAKQAELDQQTQQQGQQFEQRIQTMKAMASIAPNGNGAKPAMTVQEVSEIADAIRKELSLNGAVKTHGGSSREGRLLAEAIASRSVSRLAPDLTRLEDEQAETLAIVADQFGGFHPGQPRGGHGQFASSGGEEGTGSLADPSSSKSFDTAMDAIEQRIANYNVQTAAAAAHAAGKTRAKHAGTKGSHTHNTRRKGSVAVSTAHAAAHARHIARLQAAADKLKAELAKAGK